MERLLVDHTQHTRAGEVAASVGVPRSLKDVGLFNDAFSGSDCVASEDGKTKE